MKIKLYELIRYEASHEIKKLVARGSLRSIIHRSSLISTSRFLVRIHSGKKTLSKSVFSPSPLNRERSSGEKSPGFPLPSSLFSSVPLTVLGFETRRDYSKDRRSVYIECRARINETATSSFTKTSPPSPRGKRLIVSVSRYARNVDSHALRFFSPSPPSRQEERRESCLLFCAMIYYRIH